MLPLQAAVNEIPPEFLQAVADFRQSHVVTHTWEILLRFTEPRGRRAVQLRSTPTLKTTTEPTVKCQTHHIWNADRDSHKGDV